MEGKLNGSDIKNYVFAGKSIFTILNTFTKIRFTYKIKKPKNGGVFFVSVLTGSDNTNDYRYIGFIKNGVFVHGNKSTISADSISVKAFMWFNKNIDTLPAIIEVYHKGHCGKCGKLLTTPESIKVGIGPFCLKNK